MIDEVDKSSNNQLFLSILGMLRNKYLLRNEGLDYTFHSVILAGVHDASYIINQSSPKSFPKLTTPFLIQSMSSDHTVINGKKSYIANHI